MKSALDHGERARGDWIIADIGGTNARFTLWSPSSGVSRDAAVSYRNDDFSDLPSLIDAYQRAVGPGPARALLALALPMTDGQMQMTNRPWTFTARELQQTLGLSTLSLVNDFVAAAAGIGGLAVSELMQIGGERPGAGPRLILGPGTGLGAAAIVGEAGAEIVLASEAGHMGAAPSREDARLVMETARSRHGRASWERLLCGNGLAAFDAIARSSTHVRTPAEVAQSAIAGDGAARRAVGGFAFALGEFAGDLCLAFRATGGVYLVGGVLQGLDSALDVGALRAGFESKGRLHGVLSAVPCFRVLAADVAMRGLGRLLDGSVRAPLVEVRSADESIHEVRS